jgi:hypothetical protein
MAEAKTIIVIKTVIGFIMFSKIPCTLDRTLKGEAFSMASVGTRIGHKTRHLKSIPLTSVLPSRSTRAANYRPAAAPIARRKSRATVNRMTSRSLYQCLLFN